MKVAMITPWKVRCGISSYSWDLSHALADLDVEIPIVRLPRFGAKSKEILQDVVDRVPVDKVDLIHVQHEYGLFQTLDIGFFEALKSLEKPVITTMHSAGNWEIDRVISECSNVVVTHNEFCARRFSHQNVIIPHGAAPAKTVPIEQAKKVWGIDQRAPVVGYVGFISNYKGIETLVEAMVKVPKAGLLIGGGWHTGTDTVYIDHLKQHSLDVLRGGKESRVQWLGYVPDEKLAAAYGAMDIIVYPSKFATESGALITALSHGKAVIASHLPPFIEKEKQGALITFKDVKDLTRKIKQLLKHPEKRRHLEEEARTYTEKTSWSNIAKLHLSLYEDVMNKWEGGDRQE